MQELRRPKCRKCVQSPMVILRVFPFFWWICELNPIKVGIFSHVRFQGLGTSERTSQNQTCAMQSQSLSFFNAKYIKKKKKRSLKISLAPQASRLKKELTQMLLINVHWQVQISAPLPPPMLAVCLRLLTCDSVVKLNPLAASS